LINDIHFIFSHLRRDPHLIDQVSYVVYGVVGSGIEFKYIEGKILLRIFSSLLINLFGEDPGTGGFSHPPWTGEKKSLGQMIIFNGIQQGVGNSLLAHHILKGLWAVFPCRYYKMLH